MKVLNEPLNVKAGSLTFLTSILWGGNSISIKYALSGLPPLALAGTRFFLGGLSVLVWVKLIRVPIYLLSHERRGLLQLVFLFISQIYLLNLGTDFTLASRSTIFITTYPFFTALFAHYFIPGDRLSLLKITGMILAFSGVILIFIESFILNDFQFLSGDLMVLTSGCLLGARQVYTKRLTQNIHPGKLLLWQATLSIPVFCLLSILIERNFSYNLSIKIISAILYQGLVVAGLCFILVTFLLHRYRASRISAFGFVTPIFGVLLSYLFLGEPLSAGLLVSMLLVGLGMVIVNFKD